jgi:hypothetical protein
LVITGIRTQSFALARQGLYCLSHTSSPFYSGYFGDKVLLFVLPGMDHDHTILHFLPHLRWQVCITKFSYWLRWGIVNSLLGLSCDCDPPHLSTQVAQMKGMSHHA